jgi:outer membrane immunogenic protein
MSRAVAAIVTLALMSPVGLAAVPAAAQSNEDLAARLSAIEREVAALRKENRALRAQQAHAAPPKAGGPAGQLSAPPAPVEAGPFAAAPRAPVYTMPPSAGASWTGFYIGANLGLSVGRSPSTRNSAFSTTPSEVISDTFNLSPFGAVGGGQIGFNWQAAPHWVLGVEADFQGSSEKETVCVNQCNPAVTPGFPRNMTVTQALDWFGTARGRVGWTGGPVLFYGTGGLAFGQVTTDVSLADFNFGTPVSAAAHTAQTKTGWTAGFGAEARLFGNWTGKVEYLYLDLGHVGAASFNGVFTPTVSESHQFASSFHDHIVRFGLNYKFGDPVDASAAVGGMFYKAPPAQLAAYHWAGFYLGANVGLGVARDRTTTPFNTFTTATGAPGLSAAETFSFVPLGAIGGGQVGFNWQVAPRWVLGLETDFQGSGQKDSVCMNCASINTGGGSAPFGTTYTQAIDWFGTLRGRAGWTHGPMLVYATGGLAYGRVKTDEMVNTIPFLTGVTTTGSFSQTKVGWTAGAGVEGQLFGNWTAKAEYLYMDLGSVSGNVVAPQTVIPININPNNVNISENRGFNSAIHDHIFRLGVNYRFDPGAIVAGY